jgi:FMN phosphatase YigB (HAD superfamily)
MDIFTISTWSKRYTTIIFDLGDVLFTWSSPPKSPLPAKVLRSILHSFHWFEYEKGNLEESEVYSHVAQEFNVAPADVENAFQAARDSLQINAKLFELIRELREAGLSIYAMSNISAPDWKMLTTKATAEQWALFDDTFTS